MISVHRLVNSIFNSKIKQHLIIRNLKSTRHQTSQINVNTNVVKDVILFKYENPRFFRLLNLFGICQFGFWTYLSLFAFTSLRDAPVSTSENAAWWQRINLGENMYKNTLTAVSFIIGYGTLTIACLYTLRSVRYLVLRKGGSQVTFVTYTPIGPNRMMTVNLENVSCVESRGHARSQLPIKVRNHFLYYILDMKGEFKNSALFDYTAGLKRTFK
ncbi:hypothetical protein RN001_014709 [Aquatica leii]|uniref:Transmembrane protein 223 n=1 Tax=Aquatica leii TaxID=1421715 RepID=A0AAN7NUU2_9COLE|nr:hypothetical protein RN001_014709 [Aquatica leii]